MKLVKSIASLACFLVMAPTTPAIAQMSENLPAVEIATPTQTMAQASWQSFNSKEGRFTVQTPAMLQGTKATTTIAGETLNWQIAKVQTDSNFYAVAYSDLPLSTLSLGREAVLNSLKNRLFTGEFDWSAIAARSHRISMGEIPGLEYLSLRKGKVSALRIYLVNRRLYGVVAKADTVTQVHRFLDSFSVSSIWRPFTSEPGRFTVNLPMAPVVTTEVVKVASTNFSWRKFAARNLYAKEDRYVVAYTDLPANMLKRDQAATLNESIKATLTALKLPAIAQQGRAITLNGVPGREFMGTTDAGRSLVMRFYLSGNRLYGVFVGSKSLDNLDNFLGSFQVL